MKRKKIYDKTLLVKDEAGIRDAAEHLRGGEVVAFPTETVYGLGANALMSQAVERIYEAKGRPGDNPLIVHISDKSQIDGLVSEITPMARKLIDAFMPGPITVIMRKADVIPDNVTAGLDTVGIRMPEDKTANKFLKFCGCPVAAPSANLSGSPSPTKASHVMDDMDGYIYAVVDGGSSEFGLESTVVDATGERPVILRPGAVTEKMIGEVLDSDVGSRFAADKTEVPKAPGMKYRHYAPSAEVKIIDLPDIPETDEDDDGEEMSEERKKELFAIAGPYIMAAKEALAKDPLLRMGVFCGKEVKMLFDMLGDTILGSHVTFFVYGDAGDVKAASHYLFDGLRTLDLQEVGLILAVGFKGEGLAKAYMNRLEKAAGKKGDTTDDMANVKPDHVASASDCDDVATLSVLFVCEGNKTLSAAAEAVFRNIIREKAPFCLESDRDTGAEVYCESAGIHAADGEKPDPSMTKALELLGISMGHHETTRACASVYDRNDLILAMRDQEAKEILDAFPDLTGRVFSLSSYLASKGLVFKDEKGRVASLAIPDPRGQNDKTYEHTARALDAWLRLAFPYVLKDLGAIRA